MQSESVYNDDGMLHRHNQSLSYKMDGITSWQHLNNFFLAKRNTRQSYDLGYGS
jgi:hypothetical protein